ncbi:hypothetical protein TNCV_1009531 [Trichonephila clavipes]|nr:hypothetical protein TNCV_1009531 [Trichonephila clavipes]
MIFYLARRIASKGNRNLRFVRYNRRSTMADIDSKPVRCDSTPAAVYTATYELQQLPLGSHLTADNITNWSEVGHGTLILDHK